MGEEIGRIVYDDKCVRVCFLCIGHIIKLLYSTVLEIYLRPPPPLKTALDFLYDKDIHGKPYQLFYRFNHKILLYLILYLNTM